MNLRSQSDRMWGIMRKESDVNGKGDGLTGNEHYYDHGRPEMLEFVPARCVRVLDVGCGNGKFGRAIIDKYGAEVWGIEPNAPAAEKAGMILRSVLNESFDEEAQLPRGYFDCVVFNDVLEHMTDPWRALSFCRKIMRKNGIVVASIPNFRCWPNVLEVFYRGEWTYKDEGTLDRGHLRFYTYHSIRPFFLDAGYEVVSMRGINPVTGWKFRTFNAFFSHWTWDMRYMQFAVVARPSVHLGVPKQLSLQ